MPLVTALNFQRQADRDSEKYDWLLSQSSDDQWTVKDTHGGDDVEEIDFRLRMHDGRPLTEWPSYIASVKEYAKLLRDPRFSGIRDAKTHASMVRQLMVMCHGLALDGFTSLKNVNSSVLEIFVGRIIKGTDSILKGTERVAAWFEKLRPDFTEADAVRRFRSALPLRKNGKAHSLNQLDFEEVMRRVGLPESCARLPGVAFECAKACAEAGVYHRTEVEESDTDFTQLGSFTLYRFLNTFELLYRMRNAMKADSIIERPFKTSATALSKKHGVLPATTPTPPPRLALHLLSHAMLWVSEYSNPLIRLVNRANALSPGILQNRTSRERSLKKLQEKLPQEGPSGSPWSFSRCSARRREKLKLSLYMAIRHLIIACLIVLATFTARRIEELLDFRVRDLRGTERAGWWIRSYIQKTLQRKDWLPVPSIAARAFKVLIAVSRDARIFTRTDYIFQWLNPFGKIKTVHRDFSRPAHLDDFAKWVGTPPWRVEAGTGIAESWHWHPHQFRKFFAVLYFYRYRGATIETLAHFLRHFNLEMTRRYLDIDLSIKKEFEEVELQYRRQIARGIASNTETVQTGIAQHLAKLWTKELRQHVKVTSHSIEDAADFILRQMEYEKIVIVPKPWVDCGCPRTNKAAKRAACRRGTPVAHQIGPDFSEGAPLVCNSCPYSFDNGRLEEASREAALQARIIFDSNAFEGSILAQVMKEKVFEAYRILRQA